MKKVIVSKEACIGCGACIQIDSEHFDFSDEGYSEVISQENLDSKNLQDAISSCPTNAISITTQAEKETIEQTDDDECHCEECHCENCNCEAAA